jgi:hypothetical protein
VLPDSPPIAAVLEPEDGSAVVAGSRQVVVAAAADDLGVEFLELLVDGTVVADAAEAPYQFDVIVPAAASELRLAVRAGDTVGQTTTSSESVLTVIADPGTTATGRVLDAAVLPPGPPGGAAGAPIAGAAVDCVGVSGTTGADGTFEIAGVPTLSALISCGITAAGSAGEPITGRTPSVPPVPGGVTPLGDAVIGQQLLVLASGDPEGFGFNGRLYVFENAAGEATPLGDFAGGFSALAFDGQAGLFGITLDRSVGQVIRAPGGVPDKSSECFFAIAASTLFRFDPATGELLAEVGEVVDVDAGHRLPITDLTFEPATGRLFALSDCGIYTVDPATAGAARFIGLPRREPGGGLAFGDDGRLYLLINGEPPELEIYDPEDGLLLERRSFGFPDPESTAMALQPGSGRFLVVNGHDELFELDPAAGVLSPFAGMEGSLDGHLTGVAFVPLAPESP